MLIQSSLFPKHWKKVPMKEVVDFLDHLRKPVKAENRIAGEYQYYGANGCQGTINDYIFNEKLILLAEDGGHFGNPDRDIAYIADGKFWVNNHAHVLRPKTDLVSLDFLYRILQRYDVTPYIKGATRAKLTKGDAEKILIPLPPLPEQIRIAAILDQADQIRQKRRRAAALADEFLRSVFLEMFGDPVTNPKGWEVRKLEEIASIQIGPFGTQLHKEDYIENGIPLINPMHINKGRIIPNFTYSISLAKHGSLPEYHLKAGDIIMGRRGEMGRCAVVRIQEEGWLCGTGSLFIRPKTDHFSEYLQYVLSNSSMVEYFERQSLGATMPNLNKNIVSNVFIPIPSRKDLIKFSNIINKFDDLKKKISHLEQNNLFHSISQQFFN